MNFALPTDWITWDSLTSFAGMVGIVSLIMGVLYVGRMEQDIVQVWGGSIAMILNLLVVLLTPPVEPRALFLAVLNGFASGLAAVVLFRKQVRKRLEIYRR